MQAMGYLATSNLRHTRYPSVGVRLNILAYPLYPASLITHLESGPMKSSHHNKRTMTPTYHPGNPAKKRLTLDLEDPGGMKRSMAFPGCQGNRLPCLGSEGDAFSPLFSKTPQIPRLRAIATRLYRKHPQVPIIQGYNVAFSQAYSMGTRVGP
jgi:hypothetical protein